MWLALLLTACSSDGTDGRSNQPLDPRAGPTRSEPSTTTRPRGPEAVAVPTTPAEAATSLARAERAVRESAGTKAVARRAWEQQNAYRALGAHPEWLAEVLALVPVDLQPIVAANELAVRSLGTLGEPQPSLPDWQILAPAPPETLRGFYAEAEAASGIPWAYFAAIHLVETRLGRIRGNSVAGAQGPMQFIPDTWAVYGEGDINDNRDAILAAARFLQDAGGPQDMPRALFRYNPSQHYVDAVEAYAQLMLADERAYTGGYYHWQVYYATTAGTFLLPEGYPQTPAHRADQ
jgi:membrane-bound lytic murein transglycosylase B